MSVKRGRSIKSDAYHVYLLKCADGSIYTGITNDLKKRLKNHRDGTASKYTRAKGASRFIYSEVAANRSVALKREAEIKKWPRLKKLELARRRKSRI
jgi:putative endonuclease